MRLLLRTSLVLGGAAWLVYRAVHASRSRVAPRERGNFADLAPDPRDPVQALHEDPVLRAIDLDLDAMTHDEVEAASDLATLEPAPTRSFDEGELSGRHVRDFDRTLLDGDLSYEVGENWVESLQSSAIEDGPEPEADLDVEEDGVQRRQDGRDIPVADRGAAGPRGI